MKPSLSPSAFLPRRSSVYPLLAALGLALAACGAPQTKAELAISKLPLYEGPKAQMFNDAIEPAAFGLALDPPHFRGDAKFRTRAQAADGIAEMTVTTVTIGKIDEKATYHLNLERKGDRFGGVDEPSLEIDVHEGELGYSVLAQVQARARGKTIVAMWKHFRAGDESIVHYYFAPDDQETVLAAKEALVLQDISKL